MTYMELAAAACADIGPDLAMMTNEALGRVTRAAVRTLAGWDGRDMLPDDLQPMMAAVVEHWEHMSITEDGGYPPLWILLARRGDRAFPAWAALTDGDAGWIARRVLEQMRPELEADEERPYGPQATALELRLAQILAWLGSSLPDDIEVAAIKALGAARDVAGETCMSEEEKFLLAKELCALLILSENLADEDEWSQDVLRAAYDYATGALGKDTLSKCLAEAAARKKRHERALREKTEESGDTKTVHSSKDAAPRKMDTVRGQEDKKTASRAIIRMV